MIFEKVLSLQKLIEMKIRLKLGLLLFLGAFLVSCNKEVVYDTAVVGHWGCEQYVSVRTNDSTGAIQCDTLHYEVGEGHGYELFFYNDRSGKLLLNDSPAFIKKFNCNYVYDENTHKIVIEAPGFLYALYQSNLALDENKAEFDVEYIDDNTMMVSWTNNISEPNPFFERFFLKKIEKIDYKFFVGTWGVEQIDYYNIDYAGNPIESTIETFNFTPGDSNDGIELVFRANKKGEMRDRSQDTLWLDYNLETQQYETIIVCPDTTLVTQFTYSYDADESVLYMNMDYTHTFMMKISNLADNSFVYTNEYESNYVEKAYLKRISNDTRVVGGKKNSWRPRREGSFLSGR